MTDGPAPAPRDVPGTSPGTAAPEVDPAADLELEPGWVVLGSDAPQRQRVDETLLTVADGRVGTRGAMEEGVHGASPLVMVAGVYEPVPDGVEQPLSGPLWYSLPLGDGPATATSRRWLDLRSGVLHRVAPGLVTMRFASLARPGTHVLRVVSDTGVTGSAPLALPSAATGRRWDEGGVTVAWTRGTGSILAAAVEDATDDGRTMDRIAVVHGSPVVPESSRHGRRVATDDLVATLERDHAVGADGLLAEHRAAWAERWADAGVAIEGDPTLELAVRFCLHHLMASVADREEAPVGARGLSGPAYAGHVFWDADVFVLPFLAATHPAASRAMLEYRLRRLGAARARARGEGRAGARFPWESGTDGTEVTPTHMHALDGSTVAIHTGERELHITADVAWAAWQHAAWTGDTAFLEGRGRALVVETARYWADRIELDPDGSAHIRGVIGPDEYHEDIDDNAYTNVMARWNLRRAAQLHGDRSGSGEVRRWLDLADSLVTGVRPTGGHEQFAGYDALAPVRESDLARAPVAADVLLGRDVVAASQIIKQADVLMLHHVVPDELPAGSFAVDLDHYLPRTAHGSSLSPGVHASLLARAGRPEEAVRWLRLAARLDLDDLTGTTAGGLHLAAMGSVWQALAHGFLGLRPAPDHLRLDPRPLPADWRRLELRVRFHGDRVVVRVDRDRLEVVTDTAVPVAVAGGPVMAAPVALRRDGDGWEAEVGHEH